MVYVRITQTVHYEDRRVQILRNVNCHLTVRPALGPLALTISRVDHLVLEGINVNGEEDYGQNDEECSKNEGENHDAFEGFEGEPCFIAEPFDTTLGLGILHHLNIQIKLSMKKNPKVILLGETHVGKTSIIQVLLHGNYQDKMSNTLGACFHRFDSHNSKGEPIQMDIWDTAGQEKFRSLLTLYYKNSDAVVIVFDLTNPLTFETVDYWARQIEANCESSPCVMLVGNKSDLKEPGKGVSREQISKYIQGHPRWSFMECSAKMNWNIKKVFENVGLMVREAGREKEKNVHTSKMKVHPSKLRRNSQRSQCC